MGKNTSLSNTLQNPELVRVPYRHMRIFPGNTIHSGGFKNQESIGNYRIQLHIYDKYPSCALTTNVYCNHYKFRNVIDQQLDLYRFEPLQTIFTSTKVRIDNRKSESSSIKKSSYTKRRFKNQDSESSSSTKITHHVNNNYKSKFNVFKGNIPNNNSNSKFKFIKGNISEGKNPKLVPNNNQITQVPSTGSTPHWSSPNEGIKTSSNSGGLNIGKNKEKSSKKSYDPRSSWSTSIANIQHQSNSSKSSKIAPWGSVSTKTTEISSFTKN